MNFQTAILKPLRNIALATTLISVVAQHSFAQRTIQKTESEGALTDAELASAPGLSLPIQLTAKSKSVGEVLRSLSESNQGKARLVASAALASRNISFLGEKSTLWKVMIAINFSVRGSWRKAGAGYELFQTKGQRAEEKGAILRSESRDASSATARLNALMEALDKAKDTNFGKYLATLDPEKLQLALETSGEPEGVMSASDQSHLHSQMLFAQPFYELNSDAQSAVGVMLGQTGSEKFADVSPIEHIPGDSTTEVGLVAYAGGLMLGTVTQDGSDVSISPNNMIQKKGIPGVDSDSGGEAEVEETTTDRKLVFIDKMPAPMRRISMKFPMGRERTQLATLLESVSKQLGVRIVSDDFLRSRTPQYPWLLTDQPSYAATEALTQIAQSFGKEIRYNNGTLRLRTVTPGLDLRSEPPNELMKSLEKAVIKKRQLILSEYLMLGALSQVQKKTLEINLPSSLLPLNLFDAVFKQWIPLRLLTNIKGKQISDAESEKGLNYQAMSREQRKLFLRIVYSGLPQRKILQATKSESTKPKNAFLIKQTRNSLTLHFFSEKGRGKTFTYSLEPEKQTEK